MASFLSWQLEFGKKLMTAKNRFLSSFDPDSYNGLLTAHASGVYSYLHQKPRSVQPEPVNIGIIKDSSEQMWHRIYLGSGQPGFASAQFIVGDSIYLDPGISGAKGLVQDVCVFPTGYKKIEIITAPDSTWYESLVTHGPSVARASFKPAVFKINEIVGETNLGFLGSYPLRGTFHPLNVQPGLHDPTCNLVENLLPMDFNIESADAVQSSSQPAQCDNSSSIIEALVSSSSPDTLMTPKSPDICCDLCRNPCTACNPDAVKNPDDELASTCEAADDAPFCNRCAQQCTFCLEHALTTVETDE